MQSMHFKSVQYLVYICYFRQHFFNLPSDETSVSMCGSPAAGMMGYTVKRQPQPLTEPSLVNFHLSSSPGILNSLDQSDHSRPETHTQHANTLIFDPMATFDDSLVVLSSPDLTETILLAPSMMVRGSWRLSVEHCRSNSILRPSAPAKQNKGLKHNSQKRILLSFFRVFVHYCPFSPGIFTVPLVEVSSVYGWLLSTTTGCEDRRPLCESVATSSSSVTHNSSSMSATCERPPDVSCE